MKLFYTITLSIILSIQVGISAVATQPIQIPIYVSANDYGPNRYTIFAGIDNGPIVPYNFDTGAPNFFSVLGAQGGNATSSFTFAQNPTYYYFVKNATVSLGDQYGMELAKTGQVNYAAVVQINNSTTTGHILTDNTYGDFGAGLYGNSTLCTILSQFPIGGNLKPGWIVDVAGLNGGNGTLTIGLTANAIATAKSTPGAITMPMAFSGNSIATANGAIPGYNKAQVSGTTLSITKGCLGKTQIVPSVFDTGGGHNSVAYDSRFSGLGGGNMTLSYRGKTILSYNGTTPFGGNITAASPGSGGVRVNPGGAAIYQNYQVVFSLNSLGTGEIILVPSKIPVYVSPFQISLSANATTWCSDFIDRLEKINENATPAFSAWTTTQPGSYGPLNPQLYTAQSLSGNAYTISQNLKNPDRGQAVFNVPMNTLPSGVTNMEWMTQRLLYAASMFIGTHYQHLHLPNFNPAAIKIPGYQFPWSAVSNNPTLQTTQQLENSKLIQNVSNPYLATYGFPQPGIDCTDFSAFIYNLALGIQMHSGTPNQVSFLTASGNATSLSPSANPYTPAVSSQGDVVDALFFKSPNMGKTQRNSAGSLANLTSQLQPGDLLYIGTPNAILHVVMWLGANGTNLNGTPSSVPLVISSHDNTPAIFDTQNLNANGYPANGRIASHLPPPGVQILPFMPGNWFYNNFILAARLVPKVSSGPLVVPTGGISGTTNSISGQIINNSTVTFSQTTSGNFNGTISGIGSVMKAGTGAVTLPTANTYSGGTTIQAGSLISGNAASLGSGPVTLASGNLTLNATTSVNGNLTWQGGSIIWKPGTTLNISQSLTNAGGGNIVISTATGLSIGQNIIATFGSTNFKTSQISITRPPASTFNGTLSISGKNLIYTVTNF